MTYEEYVASLEEANYTIYKITCTVTGKPYIGITKQKIHERWSKHVWDATYLINNGKGNHFQHAIVKYGKGSFVIDEIDNCIGFSNACDLEKKYIVEYDSFENGYNTTLGGQGVPGVCWEDDDARQAKNKSLLEDRWKTVAPINRLASIETRKKQSEAKRNSDKHKVVVMDVEYNSLRQAAKELGTTLYYVKEHLRTGEPINGPSYKKPKLYCVDTEVFHSRQQAADFFGVNIHNLSSTIRRYKESGILQEIINRLKG